MSHIVMAEAAAKPGVEDRLLDRINALARAVRLEPGNEGFEVFARAVSARYESEGIERTR